MIKIFYADNTYNIFNLDSYDINALIADKRIIQKIEVSNDDTNFVVTTTYIPRSTVWQPK